MKALSKNCASKRYIHTLLLYQRISTVNKYSSAGHHEQKNKKTTGQIKFSPVTTKYRGSHRRCSIKQAVLKNFRKFTGKHLCHLCLFLNRVPGTRNKKRDSGTGVFL